MRAVYPAAPKQDDTEVSITIANGKTQMDFAGVIDAGSEYDPPRTTVSDQPDLGYARDDPVQKSGARSRPMMRTTAVTVRRPRARIAPTSSSGMCDQVGLVNSSANGTSWARKRGGSRSEELGIRRACCIPSVESAY
jgi:hypothetical protein